MLRGTVKPERSNLFPVWVGFSEVPPEGMKLNTDSFWPMIIHWMFQWAKVHPIIKFPGFGRISGGAWELKLSCGWKLEIEGGGCRSNLWFPTLMGCGCPRNSDHFETTGNHRSGLHEQPRPTRVYSWLSWHLPISCLHTFGSGHVFCPKCRAFRRAWTAARGTCSGAWTTCQPVRKIHRTEQIGAF